MAIFLEKYALPVAVGLTVFFLTSKYLDWQQRISGALTLCFFAYFVAHTVHKQDKPPRSLSEVVQEAARARADELRRSAAREGAESQDEPTKNQSEAPERHRSARGQQERKPTSRAEPPHEPEPVPKAETAARDDRSVRIGKGNTVTNSPIVTGDNVTINPPVRPYAPVVTYEFDGSIRETLGGLNRLTMGAEFALYTTQIEPLFKQEDWPALASVCEGQIKRTPEWLTPYLYSGIALLKLEKKEEGVRRLQHVRAEAPGNPAYAAAERILSGLGR